MGKDIVYGPSPIHLTDKELKDLASQGLEARRDIEKRAAKMQGDRHSGCRHNERHRLDQIDKLKFEVEGLRKHIQDGIDQDSAVQREYETGPDAPERGIGECICGWCTDSRELLGLAAVNPKSTQGEWTCEYCGVIYPGPVTGCCPKNPNRKPGVALNPKPKSS